MKEQAKNQILRRLRAAIVRKLIIYFGPIIGLVLILSLIVLIILGVTYSTMSIAGGDTNMDGMVNDTDKKTVEKYTKQADEWNLFDTWLDNQNVHSLLDRDGKDVPLCNNWATLHSYVVFWMYTTGDHEVPPGLDETFAKDMHPIFKYRASTRIDCHETKDGCECTETVEYLLTEADTMRGHFIYSYEYVTVGEGCNTTTYEQLKNVQLISPDKNRWEKLDKYLTKNYKVVNKDAPSIRIAFLHSEDAYFQQQEELSWLLGDVGWDESEMVPQGSIPENVRELCEMAGERYGVDPAVLMAIAFTETGGRFNPTSYNAESGATGLMQFLPLTWAAYKQDGDGDGVCNIYSPADAIYSAANYVQKSLNVAKVRLPEGNITSKEGREQSKRAYLDALEHYGGVYGTVAAQSYAQRVYNLAQSLKGADGSGYTFPVKGYSLANVTLWYDPAMNSGSHSGRHEGHYGIDIAAPTGTPVLATVSGKIIFAGNGGEAGKFVEILGEDRLVHDYMHLSSINVVKGQIVTGGQRIGTVGSTGYSTGSHLHYGVQQYPYRGYSGVIAHIDCISPMPILSQAKNR